MSDRKYRLSFTMDEHDGYKNVPVILFRECWDKEEEKNYNWPELVENYDEASEGDRKLARNCILEGFTMEEVKILKKWFRDHRNVELEVSSHKFPIKAGLLPIGFIGGGEGGDDIMFSRSDHYDLPVKVWGHCETWAWGCERGKKK